MNTAEVIELLKENQNVKGSRISDSPGELECLGIGLTTLRKLGKKIGRDHELALELWESDVYEARIISLLIDDPKQITQEQANSQVDNLQEGALAHVFSSCNASLAKVPFVVELADNWIASKDKTRRRCGYGLLSEIATSKKKSAPDDDYFLGHMQHIEEKYKKDGMIDGAYSILCMGKRNVKLNTAALKLAKKLGRIEWESETACEPFDLIGHLTKDHLRKRLGLS